MTTRALLLVLSLSFLCSCASYEMTQLPSRQPDLYPFAEEQRGVWIAVDDISNPRRARRYFGTDLAERGIQPVEMIVANHGRKRISVGPADVLMLRGRKVIDPLPVETISSLVKDRGGIHTGATSEALDRFLEALAFRDTLLAPGQSYHGVIFFDVAEDQGPVSRFFRVLSLYPEPSGQINAAVTVVDDKRRIRFGPFSVFR